MEIKPGDIIQRSFRIVNLLDDYLFFQTYQIADVSRNIKESNTGLLMLTIKPELMLPAFWKETSWWLSSSDYPFPSVLKHWEEEETIFIVLKQSVQASFLNIIESGDIPRGYIPRIIPQLIKIFSSLSSVGASLPDYYSLSRRITYASQGEVRLLPVILYQTYFKQTNIPDPIIPNDSAFPPQYYIQKLAAFIHILLTNKFPHNDAELLSGDLLLEPPIEKLLQPALKGKIATFEEFEKQIPLSLKGEEKIYPVSLPDADTPPEAVKKPSKQSWTAFLKSGKTQFKKIHSLIKEKMNESSRVQPAKKIRTDQLLVFTRQLFFLLKNGIPIRTGLDAIQNTQTDKRIRKTVMEIEKKLEEGLPLSEAIIKCGTTFPLSYTALIQTGEAGGFLPEVLERISIFLEKELRVKRELKSVMIYPAVMLVTSCLITLAIVLWVFPEIFSMFNGFKMKLPIETKIMIAFVAVITSPYSWIAIFLLITIFIITFPMYSKNEEFQSHLDQIKLHLPTIGKFYVKLVVTDFCKNFATLYSSGIPTLSCLKILAATAENKMVSKEIYDIIASLVSGESLAGAFKETKIFPRLLGDMVAVGEESGELAKTLNKLADYFDAMLEDGFEKIGTFFEIFSILFLGGLVGVFAVSIFIPLYQMIGNLGKK
jgi:type IV pilus assembly protein PilC